MRRIWLGLDCGIGSFGYAVMWQEDGGQPQVGPIGAWKTKIDRNEGKLDDRARRVRDIGASLLGLLDSCAPQCCYVEGLALGMQTGRGTVQTLGRLRGLVEGLCLANGIDVVELRPDVVKHAVTGRRDASKEQVARMMAAAYPLQKVRDAGPDATDALAVAHVGRCRGDGIVVATSGVVSFRPDDETDTLDF